VSSSGKDKKKSQRSRATKLSEQEYKKWQAEWESLSPAERDRRQTPGVTPWRCLPRAERKRYCQAVRATVLFRRERDIESQLFVGDWVLGAFDREAQIAQEKRQRSTQAVAFQTPRRKAQGDFRPGGAWLLHSSDRARHGYSARDIATLVYWPPSR
jgi:hypothetical protein